MGNRILNPGTVMREAKVPTDDLTARPDPPLTVTLYPSDYQQCSLYLKFQRFCSEEGQSGKSVRRKEVSLL